MSLRLPLLLLLAAAVGGCDSVADPAATNPYDPLFEGTRIGSTPTGLALGAATPTSFTITWDDVSTFETGYRIERRIPAGRGRPERVEVVAALGPDATSYTWQGLALDAKELRVVLEVDGETESEPTDWIRVVYPTTQTPVAEPTGYIFERLLTEDGSVLLVVQGVGTTAFDAASGAELASFPFDRVRLAGGDRYVGYSHVGEQPTVAVARATVVATGEGGALFEGLDFVVDDGGRRIAILRGDAVDVLDLTDGGVTTRDLPAAFTPPDYFPSDFVGRYLDFRAGAELGTDPQIIVDLESEEIAWRSGDANQGALMPDGRHLLTAPGGRATLVDLATGATVRAGTETTGPIRSVSADGASFLFVDDRGLGVGSIETLAPIRTALPLGSVRVLARGAGVRRLGTNAAGALVVETLRFDAVWAQDTGD